MAGDLPTMNYSNFVSNTVNCGDLQDWKYVNASACQAPQQTWPTYVNASACQAPQQTWPTREVVATTVKSITKEKDKEMAKDKEQTRIVRVIIADPDAKIPVDRRVLSSTEEKVTDATDQELFYELAIKPILDKHNEYRQTVVDKEATAKLGKEVYLEPVRIRDLVMTVVCVAQF